MNGNKRYVKSVKLKLWCFSPPELSHATLTPPSYQPEIPPGGATTITMKATCQCGLTIIVLPGPPKSLYVCHCLSCRAQSSSAFGLSAVYPTNSLSLPSTLRDWKRPTDSGNEIACYFCEQCGVRMCHVNTAGYISVKGGVIEGMENLKWGKATHLFTSKLPWVIIPEEAPSYEAEIPKK